MKPIGPMTLAAVAVVSNNPNCPKLAPARAVAPHGSLFYGYRTVNRAIDAGLIAAKLNGRRYCLTVTSAGLEALNR